MHWYLHAIMVRTAQYMNVFLLLTWLSPLSFCNSTFNWCHFNRLSWSTHWPLKFMGHTNINLKFSILAAFSLLLLEFSFWSPIFPLNIEKSVSCKHWSCNMSNAAKKTENTISWEGPPPTWIFSCHSTAPTKAWAKQSWEYVYIRGATDKRSRKLTSVSFTGFFEERGNQLYSYYFMLCDFFIFLGGGGANFWGGGGGKLCTMLLGGGGISAINVKRNWQSEGGRVRSLGAPPPPPPPPGPPDSLAPLCTKCKSGPPIVKK